MNSNNKKRKIWLYTLLAAIFFAVIFFPASVFIKERYDFFDKLKPDTSWVKSDLQVYFINKNKLGSINLDGTNLKLLFSAPDKIAECWFSSGGQYIFIKTWLKTYRLNLAGMTVQELYDEKDYYGIASADGQYLRFGPWINDNKFSVSCNQDKLILTDYLYLENKFKIKKKILKTFESSRGDPDIRSIRWSSDGKYAVMNSSCGIVVLEPANGALGKLIKGKGFGWYEKISQYNNEGAKL